MLSRGQIERAERDMNAIMLRINKTVKQRHKSSSMWKEWQQAADALHAYQNPVFELWRRETLDNIRAGERDSIESALAFLEVAPRFFRSGYLTGKILHALKSAPLTGRDESRLQNIILRALSGRYQREFRFYARLIPRLHTEAFEVELRTAAKRALRWPRLARVKRTRPSCLIMGDLKSARLIILKGFLFLLAGLVAVGVLLGENFSLRTVFLLLVCVWSFCRFYYFAFYVIEKHVDSTFKFSSLWAVGVYFWKRWRGE